MNFIGGRFVFFISVLAVAIAPVSAGDTNPTALLIETVAGSGKPGDIPAGGGAALDTSVDQPFGVEVGPDAALYITSVGQHRVLRLDPASRRLTSVAGNGTKGYSGDGGPAAKAQLNEPYEVRFDLAGNMYFVEMQNHIVRRVDARSGKISTVAGTGAPGFGGDGGPAAEAQLRQPHSIALDEGGQLYVADIGNHRIRRVDLAAGTIASIAGNGQRELPQDGQRAQGRPMAGPRALYVTGRTMWIALREGHSVWRMDLDSLVVHHVAGTGKQGYAGDGGPPAAATFNGPKGIAATTAGLVYVVDTENQVIRLIDTKAVRVYTVAGGGPRQRGFAGARIPALEAKVDRPHGICLAPDRSLYIGDTNNHRVRRLHE
jgi:streptogramin lyase